MHGCQIRLKQYGSYLVYPDLFLDRFSGADRGQDADWGFQVIERKISFALGDARGDADDLTIYTFKKKTFFRLFFEDPQPNGTRRTEQILSLDFHTDETNFETEGKWNTVSEELEKKFETFYTLSKWRMTKAGPMIWIVLRPRKIMQNEKLKLDKGDKDTSTTR